MAMSRRAEGLSAQACQPKVNSAVVILPVTIPCQTPVVLALPSIPVLMTQAVLTLKTKLFAPKPSHDKLANVTRGIPGVCKTDELSSACVWGNKVKLYREHIIHLRRLIQAKKTSIPYYVCRLNKDICYPNPKDAKTLPYFRFL